MTLLITFLEYLLRRVLPGGCGKHRVRTAPAAPPPAPPARLPHPPRPAAPPTAHLHLVDGPLVRPYVAHLRERRRQARRRRAIWLATVGIDIGPRILHGHRVRGGVR